MYEAQHPPQRINNEQYKCVTASVAEVEGLVLHACLPEVVNFLIKWDKDASTLLAWENICS